MESGLWVNCSTPFLVASRSDATPWCHSGCFFVGSIARDALLNTRIAFFLARFTCFQLLEAGAVGADVEGVLDLAELLEGGDSGGLQQAAGVLKHAHSVLRVFSLLRATELSSWRTIASRTASTLASAYCAPCLRLVCGFSRAISAPMTSTFPTTADIFPTTASIFLPMAWIFPPKNDTIFSNTCMQCLHASAPVTAVVCSKFIKTPHNIPFCSPFCRARGHPHVPAHNGRI